MKKILSRFPGKKVLIADDYVINQELLKEMLTLMECHVDIAEDGEMAFEMFKKNDYDAIFMDIQMPILDGYESTRKIRSYQDHQKSRIPIIAITASALPADQQKSHEVGMDGYISKPIKGEHIENALKKIFLYEV